MPHHPDDSRYPHLTLVRQDISFDRRRRPAPPTPPPNRGGRQYFGGVFVQRLTDLEQEVRQRPLPVRGVAPHLVFRIPVVVGVALDTLTERLEDAGLTIVSIEPDKAVVAFRDDADLSEFKKALAGYQKGPRINPKTQRLYETTKWDVFEYIEAEQMRSWGRNDRIGARLKTEAGEGAARLVADRLYFVDVELWHRGSHASAQADLRELTEFVRSGQQREERVCDKFEGESVCLARVAIMGGKLDRLLEMPIVAEVDLPPVPIFDNIQASRATPRNFPPPARPDHNGPRVCILDSGITANHPLLAANVGHAVAILTIGNDPSDQHGHGTLVAGLAVFGNVRTCYESGLFSSPITLFSARVLNDRNEFDDEKLIINQMRTAIKVFYASPYNCRVFNLSLGTNGSAFENGKIRQTYWAEALDNLARELRILLVVPSGNNSTVRTTRADDAEAVMQSYPALLFEPEARLCDPGTASLALTVGSLAEYDVPSVRHGVDRNDIVRPIAQSRQPSPFTRTGPGVSNAIKPDFVDYGGNLVFSGFCNHRRVDCEQGTAVMSFSREPMRELFAFDVGSSFAAPRVARCAAIVWHHLRIQLDRDPHPNLVRALLATAAVVPEEAATVLGGVQDNAVLKACGYGVLDTEFALESGDRRVTLIAEGLVKLDMCEIYEVPVPEEFMNAAGKKTITVSLAFDPPVRRRRQNYLGVHMNFDLIRGKTLDEIVRAYEAIGPHEDADAAIQAPYKLTAKPAPQPRGGGYARKKSTLQKGIYEFSRRSDYGDYYLVIRAERKWAPAEIEGQDYAVAVTLQAEEPRLFAIVEARVRQRIRARPHV